MNFITKEWNELSTTDVIVVYSLLLQEGETNESKQLAVFKHLNQLTDEQIDLFDLEILLSTLQEFSKPFLNTEKGFNIQLTLSKCPFPQIGNYHAPADKLENLTIYELGTVFTLLGEIVSTESYDQTTELLATIYRPAKEPTTENIAKNYEGDIRVPFLEYEASTKKRLPEFQTLPIATRQVLLFWLLSCQQHIISEFPTLFSKDGGKPSPFGYSEILLEMSQGLQHLDTIANQSHQNVFMYLTYLDHKRQKAELAKKI